MISGFTEILGRAGVSLFLVFLVSKALVSEASGFIFICLTGPTAWLFGLLTVLVDYVLLVRRFKKYILAENADLPTQPVIEATK